MLNYFQRNTLLYSYLGVPDSTTVQVLTRATAKFIITALKYYNPEVWQENLKDLKMLIRFAFDGFFFTNLSYSSFHFL